MKTLSCLFALAACVLYSGCTAIAVRGPVGDPASDVVIQQILGTWIGERIDSIDRTVVFERVPDSSFLVARYDDDGGPKEHRFFVTRISDGALVFWAETEVVGFLAPGRGLLDEGTLVVLMPDIDEVKALVEKGVLTAAPEEADGLFMIEPRGVEQVMATKAFWSFDGALALIKEQLSQKKDGEADSGETDALPPMPAQKPATTPDAP
jgi:hypothetical protein